MNRKGLTLTEVMMTVVVIAILASAAIPQYQRTLHRGYWRTAQDLLMTIYAGEQVYFVIEDAYFGPLAAGGTWATIYMDDPNGAGTLPVAFTVTAAGSGPSSTFTATATGSTGTCAGRTLTIDQTRTLNDAGWPAPGDC